MTSFGFEKYIQLFNEKGLLFLNQSLIFYGQKNIGKFDFVLNYVKSKVNNESNIKVIQSEEDKKSISIEQIRNLFVDINNMPYGDSKYIIIINNAEELNDASANALLKRLEEPKKTEQFILITSDYNGLIDTIKSRCFAISVSIDRNALESILTKEPIEIKQILLKQGIKAINAYNNLESNKTKYKECLKLANQIANLNNQKELAKYCNLIQKQELSLVLEFLKIVKPIPSVFEISDKLIQGRTNKTLLIDILLMEIIKSNNIVEN